MTERSSRGRLKILLGYAAGVGKTFKMLDEAHELKRQGVDAVIGYFEPHGRKDTIAKAEGLETVPRRKVPYRGTVFEEMDTDAVLRRHPQVCLVDELAHTNVPGSERNKRWEDVQILLDAGMDVITTLNVQHLESLNDQVLDFSGIRVRETLPDWVVKQAIALSPRWQSVLILELRAEVSFGFFGGDHFDGVPGAGIEAIPYGQSDQQVSIDRQGE